MLVIQKQEILFNVDGLSEATQGFWCGPSLIEGTIKGFCHDTRLIEPGDIFVAMKSAQRDGHAFLSMARERGAAAAIVEQQDPDIDLPQLIVANSLKAFQSIALAYRRHFKGKVVGVTGSCGKTSTTQLLMQFLGLPLPSTEKINWNNTLGVPLRLMQIDSVKQQHAVIEAGMDQSGEIDVLATMIEPDYSMITNVYPQHIDQLGSLEAIAHEKSRLACATKEGGYAFITSSCWDYSVFRELKSKVKLIAGQKERIEGLSELQIIRYQFEKTPDVIHLNLVMDGFGRLSFKLKPMTRGMVTNTALAISMALELGISSGQIQKVLDLWKPAYLRGEIFSLENQYFYVDCYNSLPIGLKQGIESFVEMAPEGQPRLYVIGGMLGTGEYSEAFHYEIGEHMSLADSDKIVLVGKESLPLKQALLDRGHLESKIHYFNKTEDVGSVVRDFKGAIFLKGSRGYHLENLLPKRG